jgi:hypothetical protein
MNPDKPGTPLEQFESFVSEILTVSKDDICEVEDDETADSEEPAVEGEAE